MIVLIVGALGGVVLAVQLGVTDRGVIGLVGATVALVVYFLWCLVFPYRQCWRCGGEKMRDDGVGNMRPRNCWICGGRKTRRRAGALLMGRSRDH